MDGFRQLSPRSTEAGGVLMGRLFPHCSAILVDSITIPARGDKRTRFAFVRAKQPAQDAINSAWAQSAGMQNYLGEWHTHPEDHPVPSSCDKDDWQRLVREAKFEQDALLFVIVGRLSIGVWEVLRGGGLEAQLLRAAIEKAPGIEDTVGDGPVVQRTTRAPGNLS